MRVFDFKPLTLTLSRPVGACRHSSAWGRGDSIELLLPLREKAGDEGYLARTGKTVKVIIVAIVVAVVAQFSVIAQADEPLADPALEQRANALSRQLRCVVCQSQSIAESDAEIAADMRRIVREQIAAGKTDQEIVSFLAERYGDFVLFKPPFKSSTWILWVGPFALLILASIVAALYLRRQQSRPVAPGALDRQERHRVEALLRDGPKEDRP